MKKKSHTSKKNKTKAIIFDLDGVLIDATEWHFSALNKALALFGYSINKNEHLSVYNGLPTIAKLKLMSERNGLPVGLYEIIAQMKRKYTDEEVAANCHPDYEKLTMLKQLQKQGYRLACCSNAQKYSVINMLERAQIESFFELICGNDEGLKPKPSPDMYLHAFKKLDIHPNDVYIVEDAPHGIKAAKESGAHVIEVTGYEDVNSSLFINLGLL